MNNVRTPIFILLIVALSSLLIASQFLAQETTSLAAGKDVAPSTAVVSAQAPQTCVQPPSGIVSWWSAEGNANDRRDGNHGQLEGGAGYAAGFVGRAFSFDGRGQIRVADNANLNVQAFTIEVWVYPVLTDSQIDFIVNKEDGTRFISQYEIGIRGPDNSGGIGTIPRGNLTFFIGGVNGLPDEYRSRVNGGGPIPLFTWTHIALTFDSNSARAYINGALTRNVTGLTGSVNVTPGPLKIGSRADSIIGSNPEQQFNGLIDEVALYNRALSASEIQSIFNAGRFGKCSVAAVSAASFRQPPMTRDSIAAIFGNSLATAVQSAPVTPLPTTLAGTTVKITDSANTDRSAGLFFVSPAQINFHIPPGTATGMAGVTITNANGLISYGAMQIDVVAPGLFSANADGQGVAAAVVFRRKADGTESFEPVARFDPAQGKFVAVPIELGAETDQVFLILYGAGFRNRSALSAVTATIGGTNSEALFAGAAPGFVGLDQANVRLLRSLIGRGEVDVALTVDGKLANPVRVNIR